jgi:hypothetical protein
MRDGDVQKSYYPSLYGSNGRLSVTRCHTCGVGNQVEDQCDRSRS